MNATAQQFIEPAPIVVRGKNLLLGGIRLMQIRGATADRALCPGMMFVGSGSIWWPWSNGSSAIPKSLYADDL